MRPWIQRWMRFWFEPATPTTLGVCRALFCGAFLLMYFKQDLTEWVPVSKAFWMPISLFRDLRLPVFSAQTVQVLQTAWKAALVLSGLGLWTRWSTATAFFLGIYCFGLPHNFGKTHHLDAIVLLTFGVLALSRCGDGFSLDRLLARLRARRSAAAPAIAPSGEYTWPIRLVWMMMTLVFFGAGVTKLRHSGLAWIFSDNMAMIMVNQNTPLSIPFAAHTWFCRLIAAGTILIETGAPLALVSRRLRWIIAPSLFLMQVGIRIVMGVRFHSFLVCYVFWVPWEQVGRWITERMRLMWAPVKAQASA